MDSSGVLLLNKETHHFSRSFYFKKERNKQTNNFSISKMFFWLAASNFKFLQNSGPGILRVSFFTGFSVHKFEDHCHNLVTMKKYYNIDLQGMVIMMGAAPSSFGHNY